MTNKQKHYPDVNQNPDFPEIEKRILAHWQEKNLFQQSIEQRKDEGAEEFIFYDGPPFANGLPHYGHLLTGYVKDAYARYQTMRGKRVERRFGWDCHGLPAEMGAEKELGISGRAAISNFGIDKFNDHCRTSVMKYTSEWEYYVNRQARWVDFEHDYKTMDTNFMESVLWAFKQLWDKGLVYEAHRVMPYSWAAETPLSNFETKLDNSYREKEDKAITVAFELNEAPKGAPKADKYFVLAWTTTPWTLPSNLALAASENIDYGMYSVDGNIFIMSAMVANKYAKELKWEAGAEPAYNQIQLIKGNELIGLTYHPLFPYFADRATPVIPSASEGSHLKGDSSGEPRNDKQRAFRILDGSDFVTDGDGTGIVHMAPGFGEDDQRVCAANGIEVVVPVDGQGKFTDEIVDIAPIEAGKAEYETARCRLVPFTEDDLELLCELHLNPDVAATTYDGLQTKEQIAEHLKNFIAHQKEHGFSQWKILDKHTGEFIGRSGITIRQLDKSRDAMPELRFAVLPKFWNKGYAQEAARFWLQYGFMTKGFEMIVAACQPGEKAPAVLKKLGYEYEKEIPVRDGTGPYFIFPREHYLNTHDTSLPPLSLKGLNVIAQSEGKCEDEPYTEAQLQKYGLANLRIINWLKLTGHLIKQEDYKHSYPHCWRTDTPLIYRAMPSWYVEVTKFRDRAVELNKQINWIPEHIRDGQMAHMLATAPDWSISRNRFWGTPIPVWRSESGKMIAIGSIKELEELSGQKVKDLHRPYIDEITIDKDGETYTRVSDVFDCWFESGSMPFAQVHYPFENKEWFESHFPADFITEYVGQTRGWFNTLIMLSTALFDKPPFKNCICHGVVLDSETGLKYSKRLKNYKDPKEVMDVYGADALRWLMLASPVMRGHDLAVDPEGKFIRDVVRLAIKPIWNAYNFFTLYANADGVKAKISIDYGSNVMDHYILAKCADGVETIKNSLDAYDTPAACDAVLQFFEVLNNWYIRRNKERFWKEEVDADKQAAYDTLYTVLVAMCKAAAPLLPFTLDEIYRGLTGEESVHLADFPTVIPTEVEGSKDPSTSLRSAQDDNALIKQMDWVRDVCNAALAIRNKVNIRVRQPLNNLQCVGRLYGNRHLLHVICDEVNVKAFRVYETDDINTYATLKLSINSKALGKRLPALMKQILPASKKGEWKLLSDGGVEICGETLLPEEYTLQLEPKAEYAERAQALSTNDALVILDTSITPELEAEGIARDVVRMVQQARKDAGLHVSDKITLGIHASDKVIAAIDANKTYITEQTLADSLQQGELAGASYSSNATIEDGEISIFLSKLA